MCIKTFVAGAAIALAATIGLASADEQFSTLEGVPAVAMSPGELDAVVGQAKDFLINPPGTDPFVKISLGNAVATNGAPGGGLCVAGISGVITVLSDPVCVGF